MRPLLIGEDNPYSRDPADALLPYPDKSAGWRLATKIMGLPRAAYLPHFDPLNLCARRWSMREARESAERIVAERGVGLGPQTRSVVLLGTKVCAAFGVDFAPFTMSNVSRRVSLKVRHPALGEVDAIGAKIVCATILPHPSGRSRAWCEPGAVERTRDALHRAGAMPTAKEVAISLTAEEDAARPRCSNCGLPKADNVCPDCGLDRGFGFGR